MRRFFFVFFLCCVLRVDICNAQPAFSWAVQLGDTSNDKVTCVTKDENGNIFCFGFFSGTIDVDPGPAVYTLTSSSQSEIFCCKYSSSGNLIFGKKISGTFKSLSSAEVDKQGNLFFCGSFTGTVDFNPDAGTNLLDASNGKLFVSKWNNQGQYVWTKQFGNDSTFGDATSLCVTDSGEIVIAGIFSGTADLNPGPAFSFYSATGEQDAFVLKINASGDLIYSSCFGGTKIVVVHDVACDKNENVFIAGCFIDSVDVDPGQKQFILHTEDSASDIFVGKLKKNGALDWAFSAGGKLSDDALSVDADECGNCYVTGFFQDTVNFSFLSQQITPIADSLGDAYLWKITSGGNLKWIKQLDAVGSDVGRLVEVNLSGDIFLAGTFESQLEMELLSGTQQLISRGAADIVLTKWNANGELLCAGSIGGANADTIFAMTISGKDEIYAGGIFESISDLDFSPDSLWFSSNGNQDGFLVKNNPGTCCAPVNAAQSINSSPEVICQGDAVTLNVVSEEGTCPNWRWYTESCHGTFAGKGDTLSVSPPVTTVFYVRQEGPCDTSECKSVLVEVKTSPIALLDAEISADCNGVTITIHNNSINAQSYVWQFSGGAISTLQYPAPHNFPFHVPIKILLVAIHSNGCKDTALFVSDPLAFEDFYSIEIPNVFSPNNDNINDEYFISYKGNIHSCYHLEIFDRWGARVFLSENPDEHWDGKTKQANVANPGTYFYVLQIAEKKFRGFITLTD
jgi:gliding motility-associated-like protein